MICAEERIIRAETCIIRAESCIIGAETASSEGETERMELIMKSFLEGYATSELNTGTMFICMGIASAVGCYIFLIYRLVNRNSFYSRNFNMSLIALAVITSAVILTIQSNIVVSLGMVGALSIVRFRTAIKDPMDLVFLFWSITAGIICGAGFAMIAVIASVALTAIIVCISLFSSPKETMVLVINADGYNEEQILETVKTHCGFWKARARNLSETGLNMAVEVRTKDSEALIRQIIGTEHVLSASLLEYDGEITA